MKSLSAPTEFSFREQSLDHAAKRLFARLASKYDFVAAGNYRAVFKLRGDRVLKLPLNEAGVFCNDCEASTVDLTCARGKWIEIEGLICVIQEYVEVASLSEIKARLGYIPDWVAGVDCAQVGFTKAGQLKAYDFVHP